MATIRTSAAALALQPDAAQGPASAKRSWPQDQTRPGRRTLPLMASGDGEVTVDRVPLPVEVEHHIVPGTGGHGRARADALLAVIRAFGCKVAVFGYDATRSDKFLIMVGTRPVLDALQLLLPSIAMRMEAAGRVAARDYGRQVRYALPEMTGTARRRALVTPFFRDYLRGYGQGVAEVLGALRAKVIKGEGSALAMILAADKRRIEEKFGAKFPGNHVLRKERGGHRRALEAGKDEGRAVDLGDDDYLARHDLVFAMI